MTRKEYWYLSRHGLGPGTIPKGVHVLEYKEHPFDAFKCYIRLSRVLTIEELKEYELKEEKPNIP